MIMSSEQWPSLCLPVLCKCPDCSCACVSLCPASASPWPGPGTAVKQVLRKYHTPSSPDTFTVLPEGGAGPVLPVTESAKSLLLVSVRVPGDSDPIFGCIPEKHFVTCLVHHYPESPPCGFAK